MTRHPLLAVYVIPWNHRYSISRGSPRLQTVMRIKAVLNYLHVWHMSRWVRFRAQCQNSIRVAVHGVFPQAFRIHVTATISQYAATVHIASVLCNVPIGKCYRRNNSDALSSAGNNAGEWYTPHLTHDPIVKLYVTRRNHPRIAHLMGQRAEKTSARSFDSVP
ncbi:hypothetical protein GEV33_004417 [Tenebrio molitor]|uniref:Uncharacterized protein n=1 Tax=Tenebrio molitor TaxID=7067 RepID=A0A8J6HPH8_TENMO|nr:hypothetical protein GEV33_004417 [Tenebrio molitor]